MQPMFDPAQYELLDFGDGRKLEQFGDVIIDRPSPAAENVVRSDAAAWSKAHAKYRRTSAESGDWQTKKKVLTRPRRISPRPASIISTESYY